MTNPLAINGGRPVREKPFAPWPYFTDEEIQSAAAVLRSGRVNYWTGQEGRTFEAEFAKLIGCKHAVAVANGSVALELALYALGIGPGDEVIVPSRTFIASASCALMRGATPVFADVDRESQNITAETIRCALSSRSKAIIAVHLAGLPCDMDAIMELAREHDLKVVEDCAQAHGARYRGRYVGSIGDAAAFSFCQDKIISTGGEGGMLATNYDEIWMRAWSFKDHGKNYQLANNQKHSNGFRWIHDSFGTNCRLTEIQSALGRVLLRKLPQQLAARRRNAAILSAAFMQMPALRVVDVPPDIEHAYYKYYVFVRPEMLTPGWDRDKIMEAICAEGVPCFAGSCSEVYLEKAFSDRMRPPERLSAARELGETSLMFLVHPTLSEEDMFSICCAVEKVLRVATQDTLALHDAPALRSRGTTAMPRSRMPFPFLDLKAQFACMRDEIVAAVTRVLDEQHFILGPEVNLFEREFADRLGVRHAISCASGSDALLLALTALGVQAGDEVITTPFTFIATAGAIARVGARPVFVDIDLQTYNIDPREVEQALTPRTRAILPVHLFGLAVDMDPILSIAAANGIAVVEDAAQAVGAKYRERMVGTIGNCGCFSFFPSKNLGGAGDGGLIATNDDALAGRLRLLRVHGSREKYQYELLGINSRLDELQAAILRVKLPYLESWTVARQRNAERYRAMFGEYGLHDILRTVGQAADCVHVYNQFVIRIARRDEVREYLRKKDIPTDIYYPLPLHLQPAFAYLRYKVGDFPVSEAVSQQVLALPIYPELTALNQRGLVASLAEFAEERIGDKKESQAA